MCVFCHGKDGNGGGNATEYLYPGCSGGGIIGNGEEVEQQAAFSITCAKMPGVKIQPFYSETKKLPDQDTSLSVWRDWLNVGASRLLHLASGFFVTEIKSAIKNT